MRRVSRFVTPSLIRPLILAAACAAILSACGGDNASSAGAAVSAQSKQLVRSQKAQATDYQAVVQELYVAYYGRPADPAGLAYWEGVLLADNAPTDIADINTQYTTNAAVQSVINSFGTSAESTALYGTGNASSFVTAIYQNVLGRAPDGPGLTYWAGLVGSNAITQGDAALSIAASAASEATTSSDEQIVSNRLAVATYFTAQVVSQNAANNYSGSAANVIARNMLGAVTATTNTTTYQTTVAATVASLPSSYSISGTVSGLVGSGLVLQDNGGDNLTITASGSFTFATALTNGTAYAVTVLTQPGSPSQTCTVSSGSGTVAATVTNVAVSCAAPVGIASTMTIQRQQVANSATLSASFASLSYEKSHINSAPYSLTPSNTNLIGLLNALGGGVLRIGANSVDRNTWTPAGAGQTSGQIAQIDIANFASFIKLCPNWKVIYGVNFAGAQGSTATPALAAGEAAYAAQQLGSQLLGFEIGNEVDLYGDSNTPGMAGFTYNIFLNGGTVSQGTISGWNQFAQAIRAAVPGAVLTGPAASSDKSGWSEDFAVSEPGAISLLTEHYYISNFYSAAPTIAGMLNYPDTKLIGALQAMQTSAQKAGIPFRMDETNSYFSSTNPLGVANAYAAALWSIDFIFTHAQYGAQGLNFHNAGTVSSYALTVDTNGATTAVQPLYYGLFLFSQIFAGGTTGQLLNSTLTSGGVALSAFAVNSSNGATYVVVNNKDTVNATNITINVGTAASQATVMALASSGSGTAAQLSNLGIYNGGSAITFGGQAVGLTGAWQGTPQQTLTVANQSVTVYVAPASAALVRIK